MPLSTFPTDMSAAASSVIQAADFLRRLRDGAGVLNWGDITNCQRLLHRAKTTSVAAMTEGYKAREAAEAYMRSINGPETLETFGSQLMAVEAAAAGWSQLLRDTVTALPGSAFMEIGSVDTGLPTETAMPFRNDSLPAATAISLRQSAELAALIAAFESAGA